MVLAAKAKMSPRLSFPALMNGRMGYERVGDGGENKQPLGEHQTKNTAMLGITCNVMVDSWSEIDHGCPELGGDTDVRIVEVYKNTNAVKEL